MKARSVKGDDAGGLLAAMLKGVQAECGDGGGLGMAEDAEHAAFLAQRVAVEVGIFQEILCEIWWLCGDVEVETELFCGIGRALLTVHRASLLARYQRPAGFSISFFRLSRAGLV